MKGQAPKFIRMLMVCCLVTMQGTSYSVQAGVTSTYRYKLVKGAEKKVCRHMLDVYNTHFKKPWDTPYPPTNETYGENSIYAFPKLPDVQHDPKMTYGMRFFRQPTSPEFEAITWMEGREELSTAGNITYHSVLWGDVDIDNDGRLETVWVAGFYNSWQNSREKAHNGADYLYVFPQGAVSIKPYLSTQEAVELIHGKAQRVSLPRLLTSMSQDSLGMGLRPFIFDGVTYLSSYDQQWRFYPARLIGPNTETIEIIKYLSGGERYSGSYDRTAVITEQVCKFRMISTVKQH